MSSLKEQILSEVQGLRELIQKTDREMEPLVQKKATYTQQLQALEAYLRTVGLDSVQNQSRPPISLSDKLPTSVDLIERVLERAGKPLQYREILHKLRDEEGFEVPGKNPLANLSAKLGGSPRFKRFGNGLYGLKHWEG